MSNICFLTFLSPSALRCAREIAITVCLSALVAGVSACADDAMVNELDAADVERAHTEEPAPSAQIIGAADSGPAPSAPLATIAVPTTIDDPKVAPWFRVYRPADMKALGRPLPVVAWANGGCLRTEFVWEPLYKRWAAAGMIVVALSPSPQSGLLGSFETTNVANHRALIEWAVRQNETAASPYFGLIDTKRLVVAGNSCGGVTALGVAAEEPRVNAVFVLSGSSALANTNRTVMSKIKVPVGYVVGGKEDIAAPNALADYEALTAGVPAMLVSRTQGDHITLSSSPEVLPDVAKISLDFLDFALFRTPAALATLQSPTVCTGCKSGTWTVKSKSL